MCDVHMCVYEIKYLLLAKNVFPHLKRLGCIIRDCLKY